MSTWYRFNSVIKSLMLITMFGLLSGFHWWDPVAKWIGIGNTAAEEGDLETASQAYSNVDQEDPGNDKAVYNQALVDLQNQEVDAALEKLDRVVKSNDPTLREQAFYNKGCVELMTGDPATAVESFKESLKLNPNDLDSKTNLEIALNVLQQMPTPTPPQNQDQNQDNSDEQQQQDNQQNQDGQQNQDSQQTDTEPSPTPTGTPAAEPQQQSGEQEPSPTPESSNDSKQEQSDSSADQQEQPVEEGKMSPQEAERLLDAQEEKEMEVLQRFHQLPPVKDRTIEKDW